MKKIVIVFIALFMLGCGSSDNRMSSTEEGLPVPAPQLVTNAWMFIAAYQADPETLKSLLPKGLKPHPNNHIVINMYTVPDLLQTSGFEDYTLTYLAVEVEGMDSYVMNSDIKYPGRYFVFYYNSSEKMRDFTTKVGIPAEKGYTTTRVNNGKLTAELSVDGNVLIRSTADVDNVLGSFGGGHLNYFGMKDKNVVKYPIPWNGGIVSTTNAKIEFVAPEDHPLNAIKPLADPTWAIWTRGSFVYPQYQIIK